MPDQTKNVTVRLSTEKAPGLTRPFEELTTGAKGAEQAVGKAMGSIVGDVRKADRGVLSLSRGFQGLSFSLMAMSGTLQQSGGHMSKFADHAMKAATAVAVFHSMAQIIRGLALTIGAASKAMWGYAAATTAAAAANTAFGRSAAVTAGAGGTAGPFGSAVTAGASGAAGGGAFGLLKAGGAAIAGSTGLLLGGAILAGGAAAYGIHGLATGNWDFGIGQARQSGNQVSKMEAYQAKLYTDTLHREQMAQVAAPFIEHQRQMGATGASLADIVPGMGYRRGLVSGFSSGAAGRAFGLIGALRGASPTFAGSPLGDLQLGQEQEHLTRLGESGSERRGDAALRVREAQGDFKRAQLDQLQAVSRLNANNLQSMEAVRQATERELQARVKVVDALREQGKVSKEVLVAEKDAAQQIINANKTIAAQERERNKGLTSQFGLATREEQQSVIDIARRVRKGPDAGRAASWRLAGGQWQQTPGTGTNVSPEDLALLGRFAPEMVEKFGQQAAEKSPLLNQFRQELGLDTREREAEARAQIAIDFQNKISLEIKVDEQAVEKQLEATLIPQITSLVHEAMSRLKQEMETALSRAEQARWAAERAKAGG